MPDLSLTFDLETIGAIAGGVLTVAAAIVRAGSSLARKLVDQIERYREATAYQIETVRAESNEGRKRVHQRLDEMRDHLDINFVRRETYEADQRAMRHAIDETNQIVTTALSKR